MREAEIQRDIMLAAPSLKCRLLRNNSGVLQDARGDYVRYGVGGNGGSDLIGWTTINDTAVFTAIEVKRPGKRPTPQQETFIAAVKRQGGIAAVCYSVEDFKQVVNEYRAAYATRTAIDVSGGVGSSLSGC